MQTEAQHEESTGDDILMLCAGGCGKKILTIGLSESVGSLCIDCLTFPLKSKSGRKESEIGKNTER